MPMRMIRYSMTKLALGMVAGVLMAWAGVAIGANAHGKLAFASWILILVGPILSIGTLRLMLGDGVALRFDANSVQISTMWQTRLFAWSEIESVGAQVVNSYALYGAVKTGSTESLTIKAKGGLFGSKSYALSKGFLDLSDVEYRTLIDQLEEARLDAAHGRAAPASVSVQAPATVPPAFDADAVFARHMANRNSDNTIRPTLNGRPLAGFGRKGL